MDQNIILLVEDNPDDLALTLRALRKSKVPNKVVIARDGVEALAYFFSHGSNGSCHNIVMPQLIVLDLKLPKIDGLEVLRKLRADERTKHLPVVILTTYNENQDIVNCYNYGANSYIRKPIDFARFNEVMGQVWSYWLNLNEVLPQRRMI